MKSIKSFLFLLIITVYVFCLSSSAVAAKDEISFEKWNSIEESYLITDNKTPSNSSLKNAVLKVTEDKASHRMTILFMLEFDSYTDISNLEIIMNVNDGEEIVIYTDKNAEYNEDKYFVSTVTLEQEQTKMVFMQTVLGIKGGLPDRKILTLQIKDTEGVPSNRYTVDISGNDVEDTTFTTEENTTETTSKNKPADKTKKTSKTNKADKTNKTTVTEASLTSLTEDSVTVGHTEKDTSRTTVGTGKVVGVVTGIAVLILSAGFGLSHLIKSMHQKRGEG